MRTAHYDIKLDSHRNLREGASLGSCGNQYCGLLGFYVSDLVHQYAQQEERG